MSRIAGDVIVHAPIDEVFDFVADERNEPLYNPRIVAAERLGSGPLGVGARFRARPRGMGSRGAMTLTILEYDRPHRLHNSIRSSYLHVDGMLTFEEAVGGTRLRWDWEMALVGPMRMATPFLALVGPRWERRNWLDLKRYLEARP